LSDATPAYPNNDPKGLIGASKVDLSLVPRSAVIHLATAMMDGGVKYGPYNWREKPVQSMTYIAAAERHLGQFLDGENYDPISKVHHLGHLMACCAIILDSMECGVLIDNRPPVGPAGDIIRRFNLSEKLSTDAVEAVVLPKD
jgi:hypothetical protein